MGRSVLTHSDSVENIYFSFMPGYCPACECGTFDDAGDGCPDCGAELEQDCDPSMFDSLIDDVRTGLSERFPSFQKADSWIDREIHCIAENDHCQVCISEYCGLVALGIVPTGLWQSCYAPPSELSRAWAAKHVAPFLQTRFGELKKLGTASNGESFYYRG